MSSEVQLAIGCLDCLNVAVGHSVPDRLSVGCERKDGVPAKTRTSAGSQIERFAVGAERDCLDSLRGSVRVVPLGVHRSVSAAQTNNVLVRFAECFSEVAADVDVAAGNFDVEHGAVRRTNPRRVDSASHAVELCDVGVGRSADSSEAAASVNTLVINGERFDRVVCIGIERGVGFAGDGVDLGDIAARDAVHRREQSADVDVVTIGRDRERVNLSGNNRTEGRVELAGCYVDRGDESLRLTADLREVASDVVATIRFGDCLNRCWFRCVCILCRVDRNRSQQRRRSVSSNGDAGGRKKHGSQNSSGGYAGARGVALERGESQHGGSSEGVIGKRPTWR